MNFRIFTIVSLALTSFGCAAQTADLRPHLDDHENKIAVLQHRVESDRLELMNTHEDILELRAKIAELEGKKNEAKPAGSSPAPVHSAPLFIP